MVELAVKSKNLLHLRIRKSGLAGRIPKDGRREGRPPRDDSGPKMQAVYLMEPSDNNGETRAPIEDGASSHRHIGWRQHGCVVRFVRVGRSGDSHSVY